MKILGTIALTLVAILFGAIGYAFTGWYDVSASSPHSGPVTWLLGKTARISIERRAADIKVPDLSDPELMLAGANDFSVMCAACHGAPGQGPEAMGQGLNPLAPDLAKSAQHLSSSELFWVTKHGIKMTGMPSWGATHDDKSIWPVVAFMTNLLPGMAPDEYQAYLSKGAGVGHHSSAAKGDHGEATHDDETMNGVTRGHEHDAAANDDEPTPPDHTPMPISETPPSNGSAGHDHSAHSHQASEGQSNEDTNHQH